MLHHKLVISVWLTFTTTLCETHFNKYIKHFEPLTYNKEEIHDDHLRHTRSINSHPFVNIEFEAHGRPFHLRIRKDTSIFADNLQVDSPDGILHNFDTSHVYEGSLWGETKSAVFGSLRNGIFDGNIHTDHGTYYVERANKYFPDEMAPGFHSLIYHERDIVGHQGFGGCGVTDDVLKWMHNISNSAVDETNSTNKENSNERETEPNTFSHHSKDFQTPFSESHSRTKRGVPKRRACSLYIQTDTLLWDHIHNLEKDPMKTREEITSLIAQHVKAVNHIYLNADFNMYQGIKFVVQRITINDSSACNTTEKQRSNPFCSHNIDVSNFLNLNSQKRHDAFCLAYVFTYRDFSGGTLGLAWVASPQGASGGICEQYKSYSENVGGRPIQTRRSLNTGIITFVNYNTRVPPKVSQLTLAHEIGHNFGSPHDFPPGCKPGGAEGNYIMFASATSGDRPNNVRFSSCSVGNISAVLHALFTRSSGKELCFLEDSGAFCGNKIVEDNEECDCGYDDECNEQCCYPRSTGHNNTNRCTRRDGAVCSPSQGPCCTEFCTFETSGKMCRFESECSYESRCDGQRPSCPPSRQKPNYTTECNEKTRVCIGGECVGSICLRHGKEECFLSKNDGVSSEKLCELACQMEGQPATCTSHMDGHNNRIKLRPGAPCDNFQGYCDVFQKCRAVNAEGPLARFKNHDVRRLMALAEFLLV